MSGRPENETGTYLDRILPAVRRGVERRRQAVPLEVLRNRPRSIRRASFAEAMKSPGVSLIAEVKRASPSKGPIRLDLDVRSLVGEYERAGARAISVLTEEDFFRGSLSDLRAAASATALPLLRKDFILDEYQVYEARDAGASAVLLIAAALSDGELERLVALAGELELDVLLEVHDQAEAARAAAYPGAVIGINNRDLRTFSVSLQTTVDVARVLPPDRLLVGESGIGTGEDVRLLATAGVDAILVGETLLRSPDIKHTVDTLLGGALTGSDSVGDTRGGEDR